MAASAVWTRQDGSGGSKAQHVAAGIEGKQRHSLLWFALRWLRHPPCGLRSQAWGALARATRKAHLVHNNNPGALGNSCIQQPGEAADASTKPLPRPYLLIVEVFKVPGLGRTSIPRTRSHCPHSLAAFTRAKVIVLKTASQAAIITKAAHVPIGTLATLLLRAGCACMPSTARQMH